MKTTIKDDVYRRGWRLYNRLFGKFTIKELHYRGVPLDDCEDFASVGSVLLEGWISA